MTPYLVKEKLAAIYGESFELPNRIDKLRHVKEAYIGSEHDLQKSFFAWISVSYSNDPYLYLVHAVPNGGKRDAVTAGKLKAEGVKAGIPDISFPLPRGKYHGLYIEFKTNRNKPDEDQRIMMLMLDNAGYYVVVVNTLQDACYHFTYYLNLDK